MLKALESLKDLQERLRGSGSKIMDEAISFTGLQATLCARFGYGLTVKSEDDTYFFHLPDIETNAWQASLLDRATMPDEELLLRLRRRCRPDMSIVEACAGCGVRSIFYAKSMKAARVYALSSTVRDTALTRKNALLNDMESIVHAYWLGEGENGAPAGTIDRFCKDQNVGQVDLVSLNRVGLAMTGLEGVTETLRQYGPAVIVWEQGLWTGEAAKFKDLMTSLGYAEPEAWTSEVTFWTSRV